MWWLLIPALAIFLIFVFFSGSDLNQFESINFSSKKNYLIIFFLYGKCNLKSNKGVLSKAKDIFLLETEDSNHNVDYFSFNEKDILNIEINQKTGVKMVDKFGYYEHREKIGKSVGERGDYEIYKAMKVHKVFEVKINLKNDNYLVFQSKRNPKTFFENVALMK